MQQYNQTHETLILQNDSAQLQIVKVVGDILENLEMGNQKKYINERDSLEKINVCMLLRCDR